MHRWVDTIAPSSRRGQLALPTYEVRNRATGTTKHSRFQSQYKLHTRLLKHNEKK